MSPHQKLLLPIAPAIAHARSRARTFDYGVPFVSKLILKSTLRSMSIFMTLCRYLNDLALIFILMSIFILVSIFISMSSDVDIYF